MPTWLFVLICLVAVWLLAGVVAVTISVYMEWKEGNDIHVDDLGHMGVMILLGVFSLITLGVFSIQQWFKHTRNGVLIKGSASAKAFRALSEP
jgi:hypothetical protein